jgi:hypothetical protein
MNLKSFLSIGIGIITLCSSLPALAGPTNTLSPRMQMYGANLIQGNINSTDSRANTVPCSGITVTLTESIPNQPSTEPDTFSPPPTIKTISTATATGEKLASGCKYTIDGRRKFPNITPYGDSSFGISAVFPINGGGSGTRLSSSGTFAQIPSTFDFSLVFVPGIK